jgi:uncharacterized protein YneF (UPF0154 family)
MTYNMVMDLAILGGSVAALFITIKIMDRRGRKSPRVHMIDQAKRWGK